MHVIACLLMHLVNPRRALSYLMESVAATAALGSRSHLHYASSCCYEQPRCMWRKFGEHVFSFARQHYWNTLPAALQEQPNTATFKRNFKTSLFQQAYNH